MCKTALNRPFLPVLGGPGTIPSRQIRQTFCLELMKSLKKLSRRFCEHRSSCCGANVKNCLKKAIFAHFGGPGTIPSRPLQHKIGLELTMSPKKLSRRFCGPWSSGCVATAKNCLKQAFLPISAGLVPSLVGPLCPKFGPEVTIGP